MIKKAVGYYKPYKKLFLIDILCAILVAAIELIFPQAISRIVDELLPQGKWREIVILALILFVAYLVNTFLYMIIDYWGELLGVSIENDLRKELFAHLQNMSYRFFDNNKTGQMIARVSNDLSQIGTVAHYAPEQFLIASTMLLVTVCLMLSMNKVLAALILVNIAFLLCINILFTRKMVDTSRQLYRNAGEISGQLEENFAGIRVVQAFACEDRQKQGFFELTKAYCTKQMQGFLQVALCNGITYFVTKLLPVFVILTGGWQLLQADITKGQFFSFILLTNLALKPIEMISNFVARYPKGIAGFKSFLELMSIAPEIKDAPDAVDAGPLRGEIAFTGVDFTYDGEQEILKNLSFQIEPGETVAFVGSSGSGKSTICNLIPRFYEIQGGNIRIQGMDIRKIRLSSLRREIGVVAQDVFLFSGTIEDNIRVGKPEATECELWEAAEKAKLSEFIKSQPKGMKTPVGERGVKLSGGQRQRLSIARMFLKNPPILILDEATSALDAENEIEIHKSLRELSQGRTTLVIAHRFSTIKDADRIIVVEKQGQITQGRHEELLEKCPTYKRLYDLQQNQIFTQDTL